MKKPTIPPAPQNLTGLEAWLADDRFDLFVGRAARVKLAVLAELAAGNAKQPAAEIARRFGLTRSAVGLHVRAARRIFGFPKPERKTRRS